MFSELDYRDAVRESYKKATIDLKLESSIFSANFSPFKARKKISRFPTREERSHFERKNVRDCQFLASKTIK